MKGIKNYLRSSDLITGIPSARLHFGTSSNHKSILGGVCTLLAFICFIGVAVDQAWKIVTKKYPNLKSTEKPMSYYKPGSWFKPEINDIWKMSLKEGYKVIFAKKHKI